MIFFVDWQKSDLRLKRSLLMEWTVKTAYGNLMLQGTSGEEAGAEIYANSDNKFDLFEIPQYGGNPRFYDNYENINEAIKIAESWT
jgi:hypothetical protein